VFAEARRIAGRLSQRVGVLVDVGLGERVHYCGVWTDRKRYGGVISHGNTRNGCKTHVAEKGVAMFSFGG